MKKIFSILIVFILIISTANIVFADGLTLAELKAETPERLIMNVTTKNGEVVEVDAPIILPDVDNIPTLLAKRMTFDTSNVGKDFPVMKGENQCVNVASQYWNYDGSPFISFETYPDGKKSKRNGVLDAMKREMLPLGTISVENDITVDYINELMKKIVTKYSKDEVPEFRVLRPILYSGLYYTKMERCKNKDFKMIQYPVANKNKPVKNRTRELWSVYFAQNIEGVEVFTGQYRLGYDNYHCHKPGFVAEGWIELLSEKDFLFSACAFKKLDVIKEKNLFASFESLKSKLEDRIKNGSLKNVYEIRLGYNYQILKDENYYIDDELNYNTDAKFVLYPAWNVYGYDEDKDKEYAIASTLIEGEFIEPDKLDVLTDASYQLRYDACTGEFINNYEYELN